MSRLRSRGIAAPTLLLLGCTGCAFTVVQSPPLIVRSAEAGTVQVVNYPAQILVHDADSPWDVHQIKDNVVGLFDVEVVRWIDVGLDAGLPGPSHRPVQNGIEWIKNGYAQLPDVGPVRIVDGLFSAVAIEKTTVLGGVGTPLTLEDPVGNFAFVRVILLTDWVQETLGEANSGLGYLVPWEGAFIPLSVTAPINRPVDWAQRGAITAYLYVFREINVAFDTALHGSEWGWGRVVSLFVETGEPVNQAPSQAAPASP